VKQRGHQPHGTRPQRTLMAEPLVSGSMVRPVKPGRKERRPPCPPQGYPKDRTIRDPATGSIPCTRRSTLAPRDDTSTNSERAKYTPEEQAYIDKKINEALERFGVAVKIQGGQIEDEAGTIQADVPMNKDINKMTFEDSCRSSWGRTALPLQRRSTRLWSPWDKRRTRSSRGASKITPCESTRQEKRSSTTASTSRRTGDRSADVQDLGAFLTQVDRGRATRLLREPCCGNGHWTFE